MNPDDFVFDGDTFDRGDLESGGSVNKPGEYHFCITDVVNDLEATNQRTGNPKAPSVKFKCTVMHNVDGQSPAGNVYWHRIFLGGAGGAPAADGSIKSALRFGIGIGVLKFAEKDGREIVVNAADGSTRIPASVWQAARDKHFMARLVIKPAEGNYKESLEIKFGESHLPDDPAVATWPKNYSALQACGYKVTPPAGAGGGEQAPFVDDDV